MSGIILSDNSNKSINGRITTLQARQPVHHAWTLTAPDFDIKSDGTACPCSGTLPSTVKVGDTFDCQIKRCDNDACETMLTKAQIIDMYTLPSGKQTCITAQAGTSFFTFEAPQSNSSSVNTVRGMGNAALDDIIANIVTLQKPKPHSIWIVQGTSKVWSTLFSGRPQITVTSATAPRITPTSSNIPNVGQRILFNVLNLKKVLKYPEPVSATYLTTVIGRQYTNASNWSFTIAYQSALYMISMNDGVYSVISLSNTEPIIP